MKNSRQDLESNILPLFQRIFTKIFFEGEEVAGRQPTKSRDKRRFGNKN